MFINHKTIKTATNGTITRTDTKVSFGENRILKLVEFKDLVFHSYIYYELLYLFEPLMIFNS